MDLDKSINHALAFLQSKQLSNGAWQDFHTLAGFSDEWVTGYTGSAIALIKNECAEQLTRKAWKFLSTRRFFRKGWGYNKWTPSDADSTIWGLRFAELLGKNGQLKIKRAFNFLREHQKINGAVSTYKESSGIRKFTKLSKKISFKGWCSTHICVTAAAGNLKKLPTRKKIVDYLICKQLPTGHWKSYWWMDNEYTCALAVEALSIEQGYENGAAVYHSVEWAKKKLIENFKNEFDSEQKPFSIASLLIVLCFARPNQNVEHEINLACNWLLKNQNEEGFWKSSAQLRIPHPDCLDPEEHKKWVLHGKGSGSIIFDQNNIYTTATAIKALHLAKNYLMK